MVIGVKLGSDRHRWGRDLKMHHTVVVLVLLLLFRNRKVSTNDGK